MNTLIHKLADKGIRSTDGWSQEWSCHVSHFGPASSHDPMCHVMTQQKAKQILNTDAVFLDFSLHTHEASKPLLFKNHPALGDFVIAAENR